jgi:hypothetical protein
MWGITYQQRGKQTRANPADAAGAKTGELTTVTNAFGENQGIVSINSYHLAIWLNKIVPGSVLHKLVPWD